MLAALLARAPGAWEALLSRYGGLIAATARQVLGRLGLPADAAAVADASAEVVKSLLAEDLRLLRALRPGTPLGAYLRVIARSRILNMARQLSPQSLPWVEPTGEGPPADEAARLGERAARLGQALSAMAPRDAGILRLFHLEGLDYAAIAGRLGVPAAQVGVLLRRAREKLRQALGEDFPDSM